MQPFFEGLSLELLLSILIGPVFFTLIKTSLENGAAKGLSVAFGASASDLFIMSACFLGLINISLDQLSGKMIGLFGSLVLISSGGYMIFKPSNQPEGFVNLTASIIVANFRIWRMVGLPKYERIIDTSRFQFLCRFQVSSLIPNIDVCRSHRFIYCGKPFLFLF